MKDETFKTKTDKIGDFIKDNIINFVLILVCVVYIFKGVIEIVETGKTISEIIADGFIMFLVSFGIKIILRKKGLNNGYNSPLFIISVSDASSCPTTIICIFSR